MRNVSNSFSYSIHSIAIAELQEQARAEIKCRGKKKEKFFLCFIVLVHLSAHKQRCVFGCFVKKVKVLESDYPLRNLKIIFCFNNSSTCKNCMNSTRLCKT